MKSPKVVCDAAVLAEAVLVPDGECAQLLRRFVQGREYELVLSPEILEELDHVLLDERLLGELGGEPTPRLRRFSASLGFLATAVRGDAPVPEGGHRHEDEKYLSAALEAGCLIVSTDEDLLALEVPGLEVVSPRTLVDVLDAV